MVKAKVRGREKRQTLKLQPNISCEFLVWHLKTSDISIYTAIVENTLPSLLFLLVVVYKWKFNRTDSIRPIYISRVVQEFRSRSHFFLSLQGVMFRDYDLDMRCCKCSENRLNLCNSFTWQIVWHCQLVQVLRITLRVFDPSQTCFVLLEVEVECKGVYIRMTLSV